MTDYLVFQLYGSLASWGEPAVGEMRHTNSIPGRSSILGLLAAALGIKRADEELLNELHANYRIAVRQLTESQWLRDYHTTQVPKENLKLRYATRRDELRLAPDELQTILSTREYRCDAYYLIAIEKTEGAPYELNVLQRALLNPVFPLYLGRKSCPVGLPLSPRCLSGELAQVLIAAETLLYPQLQPYKGWGTRCFWEGVAERKGLLLQQSLERTDNPISRKRWQFNSRIQHQGHLVKEV